MSTAISIENVSKMYRLGMIGGGTLQADLARWWARMRGRPDPLQKIGEESQTRRVGEAFWALRGIDFKVQTGDVVGIIGRNGAGKSTLLKILSQVTGPTEGRIRLSGRIASLLEVGTGFHPDLTGRENIFLNGAILGMTKAEIRRKLDEIIAFSGVEDFIDTPVKRYSSGMNVRLAFAVAAHLEPEILVVDEVLAVGDAAFQKKCLGKMEDVARGGRTILFVSHDLGSVTRLCHTGLLLNKGRIEAQGNITAVASKYLADQAPAAEGFVDLTSRGDRSGSGEAQIRSIALVAPQGRTATFEFGSSLTLEIEVAVRASLGAASLAVAIATGDGVPTLHMYNGDSGCRWTANPGTYVLSVTLDENRLYPGDYVVHLWLGDQHNRRIDFLLDVARFRIVQTPQSEVLRTLDRTDGLVFERARWQCTEVS